MVKKNIWPGGGKGVRYFAWRRRRMEERRRTFGDKRRWKMRKIFGPDEKKNREGKEGKYSEREK